MKLNNFGKKLKFKQREIKPETFSEKELFIENMKLLQDTWNRSNKAYDQYKINLLEYEEQFYQVIEGFVLLKYGPWKTEIILWYIFVRVADNGEIIPLIYQANGEESEEIILKTPEDLWDLLEKIEENENK